MKETALQKAMKAAVEFAQRGDWPPAILCILYCHQQLDGQSVFSAREIQHKFALVGIEVESAVISTSLKALTEEGLIGVFRIDPPDELG